MVFFWIAYKIQSILLRWTKRTQSKNEMSRLLVDAMHAGNSHKNQITDAWICVSKNPEKKTIYVHQNNCDTCVSNFQITLYDRDAGSWFQPLDRTFSYFITSTSHANDNNSDGDDDDGGGGGGDTNLMSHQNVWQILCFHFWGEKKDVYSLTKPPLTKWN